MNENFLDMPSEVPTGLWCVGARKCPSAGTLGAAAFRTRASARELVQLLLGLGNILCMGEMCTRVEK